MLQKQFSSYAIIIFMLDCYILHQMLFDLFPRWIYRLLPERMIL